MNEGAGPSYGRVQRLCDLIVLWVFAPLLGIALAILSRLSRKQPDARAS